MKYLNLETFSDFVCTGDKCEFTCCGGGWDIIIDKDTDDYYKSVTGAMGERLKCGIRRENNKTSFILDANGNCPFLNERGLCDIYINLGEEHLSDTCTIYPRYSFSSGDICFAGVSISCPEVSKALLMHKEPLLVDFAEDDKKLSEEKESSVDWGLFNSAIRVLTRSINIAQNRNLTIVERFSLIIIFVHQFQTYIDNNHDASSLIDLFSDPNEYIRLLPQTQIHDRDFGSKVAFCSEFLTVFKQTDRFGERLPEISELATYFGNSENASFDPDEWIKALDWIYHSDNSIWQENLLVYVLFKYLMAGFSERNIYDSLITGINAIYNACIFDLILYHIKYGTHPKTNDYTVMLFAHISRMVEHCASFKKDVSDHFKSKGMTDFSFLLRLIS